MALFKAGIIGCGGRGRGHAEGYAASSDVEIVACADPVEESRKAFAERFNVPKTYVDYPQMLEQEKLDFVSVCTWPAFHTNMVVAAANSGIKGIHCEKPMAPTWGESKQLYQACVDNDVIITFCHQRRFGAQFVIAKKLANDGTIGELRRVEGACPNMFDWGTHWFDMFFFYNNDEPAEWILGQIDVSGDSKAFGVPLDTSGVSWVRWKNGVEGLLTTGGASLGGFANRLIGTDGVIEVGGSNKPPVRVLRQGASDWEVPDREGVVPPGGDTVLSLLDLIDCVKTGREPELSGRKALQATELIFATYESSRRRAKIVLPLNVDDSALLTMLEQGDIGQGITS
jgi:predicted dehydrogenase